MRRNKTNWSEGRCARSMVLWSTLLGTLGGLWGCGASAVRSPVVSHPTAEPAVVPHTLAVGYSSLCELRNTELRCTGLHALVGEDQTAWVSHGTGYSGFFHGQVATCGLRDGRPICWSDGVEGVEPNEDMSSPLCAPRLFTDRTDIRDMALMDGGGCALSTSGDIDCWGTTVDDEDAGGSIHRVLSGAESMSVSDWGGCAITGSGLMCWGELSSELRLRLEEELAEEELADEELANVAPYGPLAVDVPHPVQVVVGGSVGCARTREGEVYCWGGDTVGTLGRGAETEGGPLAFPGLRAVDLIASYSSVCARTAEAQTFCWGQNDDGELGLGHADQVNRPTHVPALDGALEVTIGDKLICARFAGGELRCAGDFTHFAGRGGEPQLELAFKTLPTHEGQPFTRISFECGVSYMESDYGDESYSDESYSDEAYSDEEEYYEEEDY